MKTRLLTLLGLCLATGLHAQAPGDAASKRSPDELSELLGPIALYPDPLISLILPASSVPSDIVLADRFVGGGGDPAATDDKPWDSSVKALTRYPDTLKWMDDNLDWTTQVGDAFVNQPVDVMETIQALRAKAQAQGNLVDTPEEKVVQDDDGIRIVPAQPDSLYVPNYDPEVVYTQRAPVVEFGPPYIVGPWLGYDFDWHHRHLYWGEWHHGWDYSRGHDREVFITNNVRENRVWHVDPKRRVLEVRHPAAVHVAGAAGHLSVPHPKPHVFVEHKGGSVIHTEAGKGKFVTPKTLAPGAPKVREEERKAAVHMEEHKVAPKVVREEEHKVAPKVMREEHKEAPKVHVEEHREAPKPRVEEHKEAPKPHAESKREEDKKKKKEP